MRNSGPPPSGKKPIVMHAPDALTPDIYPHESRKTLNSMSKRTQPLHEAQLLSYLRLSPCRVGLLINFNTVSLTDGIKRCVL
jgi:PD-(D/E)XK nuclease superfamily